MAVRSLSPTSSLEVGGHGLARQYVRDDRILRTEPATNSVYDYGVNKDVENLPQLRERMSGIIANYHNLQQDILETFVDREQLRKLAEPPSFPTENSICLVFLKFFERIYAPLTAGLMVPFRGGRILVEQKRCLRRNGNKILLRDVT